MKKLLFSLILLLVSYVGFSQKGLSYQAVILDPNAIEVPGQDITGQPFVNGDVWIKFSIYNGSNLQFEEVQKTRTDAYGLVNLMIGSVSTASFNSLVWDSSQKSLQVHVSFNQGGSYLKVSEQKLTYSPYTLFAETAGKLGGVLAISGGGTGATTVADARLNLGLDQVNNTSDAAKPVSTATKAALDLKANVADVNAALAAKADTGVIKAYVDSKIVSSNSTSSNQSSSTSTISTAALALKANTADVNLALATKADTAYVITKVAAATIADADANTKGKIQLAGDLAGTAAAPTIPALALKANAADLVTLTSVVTANTASITANSTAVTTEATTARAAELVLTNNVAANTASITANTNAILLKAPIASPVFTGTVAIGTSTPSVAAALDITSTSKGLLLPRLTFAQKSAITSPEAGLILWCSDCGTNGELQVYNGTNFVNMVGANAQFALPTISATSAASAITSSALTSGGSIDSDGGAFVTARGVVWNTSTNPTVSLSTKTTDGSGIGTFSSSISGLTSGVTYYVRAYATNSVGTKYGPEITVNTAQAVATLASTTAASSIGATSATSGGNITYNGGATVTVSGLVWSTSSNPTIALSTKTSNGSATGAFTSNITGLTPGTLYYVRSYATNNVGTSYGAQTSFTTLNTPSISSTTAASSITSSSAVSGGTISADGGDAVTTRGIVYGTSAGSSTYSVTSGSGTGTFTSNLTGLTPATTYYVRSFATNSVGTVYGTEISFTTIAIAPTLSTTAASSITRYAAVSGASISSNGGSAITASGICWSSTNTTPTTSNSKTTDGTTSGTFTSSMTGLTAGTTYYVRAYATNGIGTSYGSVQSFTTSSSSSANPVLATTTSATSITSSVAILGGNVTDEGATQVSARGLVYGTTTGSSTFSVTIGSGAGTFTSTLTGLSQGTTYYVRSFATNTQGTSYGTETSFTTQTTPTVSVTTTPSSLTTTSAVGGGTISSSGGATITTSGLVWDTSSNPTVAVSTKTTDGAASGTFTSSITGLTQGTTYHVRAYATNYLGTSYGPNITFTTLTTPTVSATASVLSITGTSATTGGTITSDGGATVTSRGVVYGTTTGSSTFSITSGTGTGTYTISLTGLLPASTYYVRSFATNSVGTVYGTETSFTTNAIAPTLTTTAASSITKYAASAGGTITSNGGSVITASGICWSTAATPTTSDSKTADGTTSGTFTSSITGLTAGTTYFVRAYATNAIGTSYGELESFITTAASIMSLPTIGSSYGGGKVAYVYQNGDPGYSSSSVPVLIAANADQVGNLGGGTALWSISGGSGLAQNVGLSGNSYQALGAGLSNTNAIISAYGSGNYAAKFARDYTDGTYNDWYLPSINELGKLYLNRVAIGGFSTQYYWSSTEVQETSTQISGYSWSFNGAGNDKHMDTKAWNMKIRAVRTTTLTPVTISNPVLASTTTATSITSSSAILGGNVTDEGATQVSARGLVYGTTTGSSTFSVTVGSGAGTFTSTLTGLTQGATYYVRSFATNAQGTSYGAETSFTTQTTPTVSVTATPTSITTTSAVGGGTISSTGGATISTSGLVWDASTNPTIALSTKTTDGTTSGTFTSSITGLTQGTTYHVRAYATNYLGTSYGPDITFTTLTTPTISSTATVTSITGSTATSGGTITVDGGATVTSRGVVWGTTTGTSTYSVTSGTGTGTYSSSLTGLTPATTYYVRAFATNSVGTVYGTETSFTTNAIAPTLTTTATSSITKYAASAGGTITSNGGSAITVSGICWSTTATPTISDSKTIDGTTSGTFTSNIAGLNAGTTYYVRAYATNAIGTSYGAAQSFTTLSTSSNNPALDATTTATSITANSAILGGNITDEGATQVSVRGLVYGTTTGSSTFSLTVGSGAGTFTSTLTGLTQGTTYFVRSFATNVQGTSYGAETIFTTQTTPTVSVTATPTSITTTSALGGGTISSTGGATITTSGLVWGASTNPEITLTTKTTDGTTSGTFTSSITGLTQGATYHVRAYATNYLGTSYGPDVTFTTVTTPTVSATTTVTSITGTTATTGGTITADGGVTVTSRGVVFGTSAGSATYSVTSGTGTGTYTISLTGLTPATTYFVRSFATNSVGTVYGTETNFVTLAIAPSLTTTVASSITKYAASAGGTITSNGGSTITASGICWSTTATPTTSDFKSTDGITSGTFTSSITGLTAGTTYYVRAYATNAIGTSYGAAQSFTTLPPPQSQSTVLIGTQRWTDKNLEVTTYRNGDAITYAANATEWNTATNAGIGAWSYYDFDPANGAIYGKLYNWYAVADSRFLAPAGYHISTKVEYNTLSSNSASSLKSTSSEWGVQIGTNTTGFTGLPGGSNNITSRSQFEDKGTSGWFWTSDVDPSDNSKAYLRLLHRTSGFIEFSVIKLLGASVRLVKDNNAFETGPTNPVLEATTSATSITSSSAILGGNITDEGATQVSSRGLVYGTTTGSSTFNVTVGSGGGTFTSTLTGLAQGTMYFVRSFATNAQGTAYGAETSFTTLAVAPTLAATTAASSIAATTATSGGNITTDGGSAVTARGIVWGTATNPTIALSTKTTNGTGTGAYTSSLTGLAPLTMYYVRSYATNAIGTVYGTEISFTTLAVVPTQAAITTQPSGAVNGVVLTTQPVIKVTDASGNTATTSTVSVVASIASGSGTLSGTTTVAAVNGVATFTDLVLAGTAGNFTLAFTPTSLTAATSTSIALSFGAATKAVITTQPSGAVDGTIFTTQPVIRITDASGNTVTSSTQSVVASIASGSGGTLSGTTTVAAVNGVATFTNLKITGSGSYTITFTPTSLIAATSESLSVSVITCATGGPCAVGDIGPGGGTVFYVASSPFTCGPTLGSSCRYLEAAPTTGVSPWASNATAQWAPTRNANCDNTSAEIGTGYKNSIRIAEYCYSTYSTGAAALARAYRGPNNLSDWFLPSKNELRELYNAKSRVPGLRLAGGGNNSVYWSSTGISTEQAFVKVMADGVEGGNFKDFGNPIHAIRAF